MVARVGCVVDTVVCVMLPWPAGWVVPVVEPAAAVVPSVADVVEPVRVVTIDDGTGMDVPGVTMVFIIVPLGWEAGVTTGDETGEPSTVDSGVPVGAPVVPGRSVSCMVAGGWYAEFCTHPAVMRNAIISIGIIPMKKSRHVFIGFISGIRSGDIPTLSFSIAWTVHIRPIKFPRRRRPAAPLFSGWNWVPKR